MDDYFYFEKVNIILTIHAAQIAWYGVDPDVFTRVSSDHSACSTSLNMIRKSPPLNKAGVTWRPASRGLERMKEGARTLEITSRTFISSGAAELRPWCGTPMFYRTLADTDIVLITQR